MIQLDFAQLHELASVTDLIEPLRLAFLAGATVPPRLHYDVGKEAGAATLLVMPSWRAGDLLGIKVATVFRDNPMQGLPSVNGQYLLLSGRTGEVLAALDGRALTLLRTAAVSALAAKLLAPRDARTLLLVGTGALIPYLARGHAAVRQYASINVWGRDKTKAAATVAALEHSGLSARVAEDLESAVRSADVISCATMSERPLVLGRWLKPTTHLDLVDRSRGRCDLWIAWLVTAPCSRPARLCSSPSVSRSQTWLPRSGSWSAIGVRLKPDPHSFVGQALA